MYCLNASLLRSFWEEARIFIELDVRRFKATLTRGDRIEGKRQHVSEETDRKGTSEGGLALRIIDALLYTYNGKAEAGSSSSHIDAA